MLTVKTVSSFYGSVQALFDVSLEVEGGATVGIIGPNGAGKTTLLDCITAHKEFEGTITFEEDDVHRVAPWELADRIGYVTEKRNLFEDMSVRQNLTLGGFTQREELDRNLRRIFDLFPRLEERAGQKARTLSGGEQQMLAIGRGLMSNPDLLVLDEPSLGLAPTVIKDIGRTLEEIRDTGLTLLIAEQNVTFALEHAEELILLENGTIERQGPTEELGQLNEIRESYFGK